MPFDANDMVPRQFSALVWLLLENKWIHPIPEKLTFDTIGLQNVDVVQTRLNGQRMDFAFSKKTHLLLKESDYLPNGKGDGEHRASEISLSDYFEYQGIMIPKKVDCETNIYQFNVEYNEEIFSKAPLPVESAAGAWKKK